jgi:hypothetical protein
MHGHAKAKAMFAHGFKLGLYACMRELRSYKHTIINTNVQCSLARLSMLSNMPVGELALLARSAFIHTTPYAA